MAARNGPPVVTIHDWPGQPSPWPQEDGRGHHAVVLSWHVAPDFGVMAGQDRMLAIWAEPLLDHLVQSGARTTLLLATVGEWSDSAAESALGQALASRGIELVLAAGTTPIAMAQAVDAALEHLAPDILHAPERLGLALIALGRRAAGLAHLDTAFVLHARGGTLYQMEEQARFIADPAPLLADEMERQAMRHADALLAAGPALTQLHPAARPVTPLTWLQPLQAAAPISELVFPLPLCSEAGLEFALGSMAAAARRQRFPLPVTFLGQPGRVTIGTAAQAVARLAALGGRLEWQLVPLETPQQACRYLAGPGRLALFTGARGTPPEWLEFCGQSGIPALATANADTSAAARRWPGLIHVAPRAERSFAAVLAALPALPTAEAVPPPPQPPAPPLTGLRGSSARLLLGLSAPAAPDLTVFCPMRTGLLASLDRQDLASFSTVVMADGIATLMGGGITPSRPASRPLCMVPDGPAALAEALGACQTRFAVLVGEARGLRPAALAALRHAALVTGAAAITAWDSASVPLGGGAELALLRPGITLGHVVLVDLPALRASGGRSLAAAGSAAFAGTLAEESGGVLLLPAVLADAAAPPATPLPPPLSSLPARLAGVPGMALFYAATSTGDGATANAMAIADRGSAHYLKLTARLLDAAGRDDAAADAWDALLARERDDGEIWTRHAWHALRRHGRLPDLAGFADLIERHGMGALGAWPGEVATMARAMARGGLAAEAVERLAPLLPLLHAVPEFLAALALAHARCPPATRAARAWPALPPPAAAAFAEALARHGLAAIPPEEAAP